MEGGKKMANKKVSDKDYLFISSMLKARENRMLRRDRLEQMLTSGSFEEAARLLAEIGWPDLSGKGSAAVSEAPVSYTHLTLPTT